MINFVPKFGSHSSFSPEIKKYLNKFLKSTFFFISVTSQSPKILSDNNNISLGIKIKMRKK